MARQMATTHTGLPFTVTDGGHRFMVGKDACHDALAWTGLDGDGCIDLVAIATESGNYEDTDHELVAISVPTGNALWRALPGEVSKRVSLVNGVIVASARSAARLVGLDARTGQKLWDVALPDLLEEDNFDDDRARAIQPFGGVCAIQCKDDTFHLVDARTGNIVKSGEGKWKALGGGVPGLAALDFEERLEIWDVPKRQEDRRRQGHVADPRGPWPRLLRPLAARRGASKRSVRFRGAHLRLERPSRDGSFADRARASPG